MISIDAAMVESALDYTFLIERLKEGFKRDLGIPKRHHHNYPNPKRGEDSTLLIMPAWESGKVLGIKVVNVVPGNGKEGLPAIHGLYLYFDAVTGIPLSIMDSNMITKKRTAATSALASTFLSRQNSSSLLVVGTGAMAPELIRAHCTVRKIEKVLIWGRNFKKALTISKELAIENVEILPAKDLESAVRQSDIISTATLSIDPLIKGAWLSKGKHIDLVGSYRPDMREADDEVIMRSSLFIDSFDGAPYESGDLSIPLNKRVISLEYIKADLFQLCRGEKTGRTSENEITCFKSVGHALEDLVAAQIVYENYNQNGI